MHRKFASIAHPDKYGYTYDSDKWEYRATPFLSATFRMFETYGDGMCQHSTDFPVTEDYAIDYLFSLAAVLIEDEELADRLVYEFHQTISIDALKFAASLVYDSAKDAAWDKKRYYSMELQKVTRNREKQHDNRYKELNEFQNSTPESIFALLNGEHSNGLQAWQRAERVREWCADNLKKNQYMEMPAVYLKWFQGVQHDQYDQARRFRDAFYACQSAADIHRLKKNATQEVEGYRAALKRKADREAQAAAAQAQTPAEKIEAVAA